MKYFVTGATGFIGGRLVQQLLEAGAEVTALVRDASRASKLAHAGVHLVEGDLGDRESLLRGMQGVDGVYHLAAWYKVGVRDTSQAHAVNVTGTRNVLEVMRELGIVRGVYTSTVGVNSDTGGRLVDESYRHAGPWITVYEHTKWQAHYEVAVPMIAEGLPLIIVKPGLVYGPGDAGPVHHFMLDFLRERFPLCPRGTAFCWGHVDDTARGHRLAMERGRPGETYIIAGPVHSMQDVIERMVAFSGRRAPRLHLGPRTMKSLAAIVRLVGALVPLPPTYSAETLRGIAGATYIADSARARRELGFVPRSLEEGLRETVEHEMRQLGLPLPETAE